MTLEYAFLENILDLNAVIVINRSATVLITTISDKDHSQALLLLVKQLLKVHKQQLSCSVIINLKSVT